MKAEEKSGWSIKKLLKEIAIGLLILFLVSNIVSYLRKPELSSDKLPGIEAKLLDGRHFQVPNGKPLIIHFWATWCPTCKLEAANIQHVSQKYELLSIAVNSGSDEKVKAYMVDHQLDFRVLNDTQGTWAKAFKVEVFPSTFIYDADGKLRFTEVGYTTTAGLLARMGLL